MNIRGDPSWIPTQGIGDKLPTPSSEDAEIGGGSSNIGAGSGDIKPGI